jgi:glycosyltransferase involved in cell wall biosynthesis
LAWDQWLVPSVIKKTGIDIIFNTKFSVPIMTKAKKIMTLHGASWFVHPEFYQKFDIFYVKRAMPIYCREATFLISNSALTTDDFIRILHVPEKKIATIHLAAGDEFYPVRNPQVLEEVRTRYKLPDRFILTVTSYESRKNFATLLKAFELCRNKTDVHLVVVGKSCDRYREDFNLKERGLEQFVHFLGWVDQKDLPVIYSLAKVFAFPSIYEEFGIPVVEAMSCGCPVVSSSSGAISELTNNSALLSDPFDHQSFANNLLQILLSDCLGEYLRAKGLKRAKNFSWSKAAQQTLEVFRQVS